MSIEENDVFNVFSFIEKKGGIVSASEFREAGIKRDTIDLMISEKLVKGSRDTPLVYTFSPQGEQVYCEMIGLSQ